ncbi:PQQ-dependent sugar dehydrogenase [Desertivirga xinjiangensis]|uniref:PQQ-dependent sugar dehydrogenase n=1 Tax=Desertivirga xinjiangensis TaxID=539206 RepID=UPI00210E0C83|nr:PQQ-dependent sugar dehydrogenase [Pedobacter xinjiangensis]
MFQLGIVLTSILALSTCKQNSSASNDKEIVNSATAVSTLTLYDKLDNPWGMVWLPDGRLLVTERSGEILIFKDDKYTGEKITGLPKIAARGQGGLMDIQLHPQYSKNGWIYLAYSKPLGGAYSTAILRAKLQGNQLVEKQDIFVAGPALSASHHFGSRIAFDKEGYMFVVAGERGTNQKVQNLSNDHGKIHRLLDDGRVPKDNPFVGQANAKASIWSYGHRNPQGLAYDAANNRLWAVEHGPKGGDELNLVEKGKNYGWPIVTYGIGYDGSIISDKKEMKGVQNPVKYWVPSPAPCGMALVTSDKYPSWKGSLLIANLSFKYLGRITLDGTKFKSEEKLLENVGRVRHVAQSPDGFIYVVTEGPGKLLKIMPGK